MVVQGLIHKHDSIHVFQETRLRLRSHFGASVGNKAVMRSFSEVNRMALPKKLSSN